MNRRQRLFKRKLIQAKRAGTDLQKVVPSNMKNKKLLALVEVVEKMKLD